MLRRVFNIWCKDCGTCNGNGGWNDGKTGTWKTCSRCNGTGQE